jgi:hypothetical protein
MDQFWGTLVIYPDGISPSSGEKNHKMKDMGLLWGQAW